MGKHAANKQNLVGEKFNRLTVISEEKSREYLFRGKVKLIGRWKCECECGNITVLDTNAVKHGGTKSCGCLQKDSRSKKANEMVRQNRKYHPSISTARSVFNNTYRDGNLTFDDFYRLSQQDCFYCGEPPSNKANAFRTHKANHYSKFAIENGDFIYNGLDRVNSNLPHNLANVVTTCFRCNRAKSNTSLNDFVSWIEKLVVFTTMPEPKSKFIALIASQSSSDDCSNF